MINSPMLFNGSTGLLYGTVSYANEFLVAIGAVLAIILLVFFIDLLRGNKPQPQYARRKSDRR